MTVFHTLECGSFNGSNISLKSKLSVAPSPPIPCDFFGDLEGEVCGVDCAVVVCLLTLDFSTKPLEVYWLVELKITTSPWPVFRTVGLNFLEGMKEVKV